MPDWATSRQIASLGFRVKYYNVYRASKKLYWQLRTEITGKGATLAIVDVIVNTIIEVVSILNLFSIASTRNKQIIIVRLNHVNSNYKAI